MLEVYEAYSCNSNTEHRTFIWVFASSSITILLPIIETRNFFVQLFSEIVSDFRGRRTSRTNDSGFSGENSRVPSIQGIEGVELDFPTTKADPANEKTIMSKEEAQGRTIFAATQ